MNVGRYFKDYPSTKEKRFQGYSYLYAEIKSTRFGGIEFFCGMPVQIYKKSDGSLSLKGSEAEKFCNAFRVGLVPYEWVDSVDLDGDEFDWIPQFYCHFKGRASWRLWIKGKFFRYPYKKVIYYKESEFYNERVDPLDAKYEPISVK